MLNLKGNGADFAFLKKKPIFHGPVKSVRDLSTIKPAILNRVREQEIGVRPSATALDPLVGKALDEMSNALLRLRANALPVGDDLLDNKFVDILHADHLTEEPGNHLLQTLKQGDETALLIETSKRLNATLRDGVSRHILARPGLFHYAAFRGVIGLNVDDAVGLVSTFSQTIDGIKTFLNQRLVKEVIRQEALKVSDDDLPKVLEQAGQEAFGYGPGEVKAGVLSLLKRYREGKGLIGVVNSFLKTEGEAIPYGVSREDIAAQMVAYLRGVGLEGADFADPAGNLDPQVEIPALQQGLAAVELQLEQVVNEDIVTRQSLSGLDQRLQKVENQSNDPATGGDDQQAEIDALKKRIEELEARLDNSFQPDDFKALPKIEVARNRRLYAAGVFTYEGLLELKNDDLKRILPGVSEKHYPEIRKAAKKLLTDDQDQTII